MKDIKGIVIPEICCLFFIIYINRNRFIAYTLYIVKIIIFLALF